MQQPGTLKMGRTNRRFAARAWAKSRTPALTLLLILSQILLACSMLGGENADPYPDPVGGSDLPVAGTMLTCSQECADRGQCGTSTDLGRVVLLSSDAPAVSPVDFELAVADGATVSVLETRSVDIQENESGFQFPINFYRVLVHDRNVEGWVAAWCILNP